MSWFDEKGLFEHKCTLAFMLLAFIYAKWTKSMPTFVQAFYEVWWY